MSTTLALAPAERETVQYSPSVLEALPTPRIISRRRTSLFDYLSHWSICTLMFVSSGAAIYRLLWMGQ